MSTCGESCEQDFIWITRRQEKINRTFLSVYAYSFAICKAKLCITKVYYGFVKTECIFTAFGH